MKSAPRGQSISEAEVTNVSVHGFWLLLTEEELLFHLHISPGFGTLLSVPSRALNGRLQTTCTGRTWTSTWPLNRSVIQRDSLWYPKLTHKQIAAAKVILVASLPAP